MLGVVLPFKAFQAVLEVGDFETHAMAEVALVGVGSRDYVENEGGVGASRHVGGHADGVAYLNGFTCIDRGRANRWIADGDVLRVEGAEGGCNVVGHGSAVVAEGENEFGGLARVEATVTVASADVAVVDGHDVVDSQQGCKGIEAEA